MLRRFCLLLVTVVATGVTIGLFGTPTPDGRQATALPAIAQGCNHAANQLCSGGTDLTKTSAMTVRYADGSAASVIPNGTTYWTITTFWYPAVGSACANTSTSTCTVNWSGSSWTLSNIVLGAGVNGIALCDTSMCDYEAAVGFKLIVNIDDPQVFTGDNLDHIDYVTTSVPNGTVCESGSTTPVSQTNSGTHYISTANTNLCPFTCSVNGGSMTIKYN